MHETMLDNEGTYIDNNGAVSRIYTKKERRKERAIENEKRP